MVVWGRMEVKVVVMLLVKRCAIFLGLGQDLRFTRLQHGGHFAAIHRASEGLGLRTKVTDHF